MQIIYDGESGDVIVVLEDYNSSAMAYGTHQYQKFGVTMYWDGHGGLLGFRFSQEGSISPELYRIGADDRMPLRDQQAVEGYRR